MITNIGKNLVGKYLVGNSTQYASHIAIGSGSQPITTATSYSDYSLKTEMDFEMTRVPIISRSYINDKTTASITNVSVSATVNTNRVTFTAGNNNFVAGQVVVVSGLSGATIGGLAATVFNQYYTVVSATLTQFIAIPFSVPTWTTESVARTGTATGYVNKISFTAELPLEERYEITELALWSDLNNPISSGIDSRNIFNFSRNKESWKYYLASSGSALDIVYVSTALDLGAPTVNFSTNNIVFESTPGRKAILTNSDNVFFNNVGTDGNSKTRITRYERPRFLDDALVIRGDMSKFSMSGSTTVPNDLDETATNDYLLISGVKFGDLDQNSADDEFSLVYSLINANAIPTNNFATIQSINFMIQFETTTGASARYHFKQTALSETNRYRNIRVKLGDTTNSIKDSSFTWSDAVSAKIYASIQSSTGTQLTEYALVLDGLSFVNKTNLNESNYGMVAYVPVRNTTATPLLKESNSSNLVEFRLILGGINV